MAAATFALWLCVAHGWDGKIAAWPLVRPLGALGLLSYSLYLFHWPLVKWGSRSVYMVGWAHPAITLLVTVPVCIAVAIAVALPFHLLVERRFHGTKRDDHLNERDPLKQQAAMKVIDQALLR